MEERDTPGRAIDLVGHVVAGPLFYGGAGWLVDLIFHTSWGLVAGLLLGLVVAVYGIWSRYGGRT